MERMERIILEIKPRFRFRYNALFLWCSILGAVIFIQHTQIQTMKNTLSKYAKVNDVKARSEFMNFQMSKIEIHALDAHAIAESAYDMAYERMSRDEWIVGLSTEEIDSIRLGYKPKPQDK